MAWVDQTDEVSFKPTPITDILKTSEPIKAGVKHMYVCTDIPLTSMP
jgi:hypothetical protein